MVKANTFTKMSTGMRTFDSTTTLTVSEGYDLTNQQHYSKRRCQCACGALNRKVTFRVWHLLLFFFVILLIMLLVGVLAAMYGPREPNSKHSKVYVEGKIYFVSLLQSLSEGHVSNFNVSAKATATKSKGNNLMRVKIEHQNCF